MKLSVIVPSIRPQNLLKLYNSIDVENFEMIIVSPIHATECPFDLLYKSSLGSYKWIQSYRSPNACQQIGLMVATGDYVCAAADDGEFLPGALNEALEIAEEMSCVVVGKYLEGENPNPDMFYPEYYQFKYHETYNLKGVPQESLIFNCGVIRRDLIMQLGGWDAKSFDCTTMAHADLGIRVFKTGTQMALMTNPMFKCSHEPKRTGTHGPIHDAMNKKDIPNFKKLYAEPNDRIKIDINNWQNTPEVWARRFK